MRWGMGEVGVFEPRPSGDGLNGLEGEVFVGDEGGAVAGVVVVVDLVVGDDF